MEKRIYKLPISPFIKYNPFIDIVLESNFIIKELKLGEKQELNLDYWNKIMLEGEYKKEKEILTKEDLDEKEKEVIELLEDLDEDLDEKIEEYKWKKDLEKLRTVIDYLVEAEIEEILYIIDIIFNDNHNIRDLAINSKKINKNFRYILNEYTSLKNEIKNDDNLKYYIKEYNTAEKNDKIRKAAKRIKALFINFFKELEEQITNFNVEKDEIIKKVYEAKKGNKAAREYIIGNIIYKEADKIAKKYAIKSNKPYHEKEQIYNDLLQEAVLSSITWLEKYDVNKSDNFVYYIRYWIKQGIHKALEEQYNEIKIPSYIIQLFSKIKNINNTDWEYSEKDLDKIVDELEKNDQKKIDKKIKELKYQEKKLKWKELDRIKIEIEALEAAKKDTKKSRENIRKKVKNALERINDNSVSSIWSILKNIDDDNETGGLEANILIDETANIEENLKNEEASRELKWILKSILSEEEYFVLKNNYWLFDTNSLKLYSVWKIKNVTTERVRQIRDRAKEKISQVKMDKVAKFLSKENPFLHCEDKKKNNQAN